MNARPLLTLTLLLAALPAYAGDARLEYGYWFYSVSGADETRGSRIDFESDIDIQEHGRSSFDARWDTSNAWIPDFAAGYFRVDAGGSRTVSNGLPFPLEQFETILADADLRDVEGTIRWGLHESVASAWLGVTVKHLWGDIVTRTQGESNQTREPVSETFPMIHVAAEVPLGDRFTLNARVDWISSGDDAALEWRGGADVRLFGPVGLTAAWQRRHYRVRTTHDSLDATLDGGLLGIYARW